MSVRRVPFLLLIVLLSFIGAIWLLNCDTSSQLNISSVENGEEADDAGPPDTTPPDAPTVYNPVSPTGLTYQSIKGTAEPDATIHVIGGLAEATAHVETSGDFCAKVALKTDATNVLEVTAVDAAGNVSEPTSITIVQQKNVNYARTALPSVSSTSHSKPENTRFMSNDGNYLTWWENTTQVQHPEACYNPQWLALKLTYNIWVNSILVYWGNGDFLGKYEYGTIFDVYVNDQDAPGKMPHEVPAEELADYGYTLVQHIEQLAGQEQASNFFDLSESPIASRWVFLALYEGNSVGLLPCAGGRTTYSYEVAELEIYGYEYPDEGCE